MPGCGGERQHGPPTILASSSQRDVGSHWVRARALAPLSTLSCCAGALSSQDAFIQGVGGGVWSLDLSWEAGACQFVDVGRGLVCIEFNVIQEWAVPWYM